jgi:hypothetical protein
VTLATGSGAGGDGTDGEVDAGVDSPPQEIVAATERMIAARRTDAVMSIDLSPNRIAVVHLFNVPLYVFAQVPHSDVSKNVIVDPFTNVTLR